MIRNIIEQFAGYDCWANHLFIDWLSTKDDKILQHLVASSFPSIDLTIQHITRTQRFWLQFVTEQDISNFDWTVKEQSPTISLFDWQLQSKHITEALHAMSDSYLLEELYLNMPWAKNKKMRYTYVMHLFNHTTFHRGQIVTMARQLGISSDIPASDWNIWNSLSSPI